MVQRNTLLAQLAKEAVGAKRAVEVLSVETTYHTALNAGAGKAHAYCELKPLYRSNIG